MEWPALTRLRVSSHHVQRWKSTQKFTLGSVLRITTRFWLHSS